jgi:cytochrome c-type biogenesis protein CcmH
MLPRALAVVLLALALLAPAGALAATPRASLPDIEDEVMCVECGTALFVSDSPVARQERALIRRLIAQGKTKAEIKDALVAEYGPGVLATPQRSGFDWSAYLVPVLLVVLALGGVGFAAWRWRQPRGQAEPGEPGEPEPESEQPPLDPEEARRLDAELAAFDK